MAVVRDADVKWDQFNGCRIYGPPKEFENFTPLEGSEVFIGRLPRDCFEVEVYLFLKNAGPVYDVHLMVNLYGQTRGFAFARFCSPESAVRAIEDLNQKPIRPGHNVGVTMSTDHRSLLLIGLNHNVAKGEIFTVCDSALPGSLTSALKLSSVRPVYLLHYTSHCAAAITKHSQSQILPAHWGPSACLIWQHNEEVEKRTKEKRVQVSSEAVLKSADQNMKMMNLGSGSVNQSSDEAMGSGAFSALSGPTFGRVAAKENQHENAMVAYARQDSAARSFTLGNTSGEQEMEKKTEEFPSVVYARAEEQDWGINNLSQIGGGNAGKNTETPRVAYARAEGLGREMNKWSPIGGGTPDAMKTTSQAANIGMRPILGKPPLRF